MRDEIHFTYLFCRNDYICNSQEAANRKVMDPMPRTGRNTDVLSTVVRAKELVHQRPWRYQMAMVAGARQRVRLYEGSCPATLPAPIQSPTGGSHKSEGIESSAGLY